MKRSILIAENYGIMHDILIGVFSEAGYEITEAEGGLRAIELCAEVEYDVIIMDAMLPEIDGYSVCRKIRKTKDTPIILISERDSDEDKLIGYELGADDFISIPCSAKIILAKANALINRARGTLCGSGNEVSVAGITVNQDSHTVLINDSYIDLTPKEFELLSFLMINKGRVFSRDALLSRVWGYDYFGDLRTVDTHIKKLRAKLGQKAVHIRTLIKAGYKFEENPEKNG